MNGKLFVLEGLDGSGKSTQFELLQQYLNSENVNFKAISFPDYEKPSSALVKMYLNGDFSKNAADINAYAASSFYAVDRYASYKLYWEKNYNDGDLILAARYVTSNAIYQMVKLEKAHWDEYLEWLKEYEYGKLELPAPDRVIFLDMPVEVSQKLLSGRYNGDDSKKDIHEVNVVFLKKCREAALYAADKFGWIVVPCSKNNEPLPIDEIQKTLRNYISELI